MRHPFSLALLTCLIGDILSAAMPNLLLARQSCDSESWVCPDWGWLWGVFEGVSPYLLPSSPQDSSGGQLPPSPDDGQAYPGNRESENQEEPRKIPSTEPAIEIDVLSPSDRKQCDALSGSGTVLVSHFQASRSGVPPPPKKEL